MKSNSQQQSMLPFWLVNTLLDDGFIQKKMNELRAQHSTAQHSTAQHSTAQQLVYALDAWLSSHFDAIFFEKNNEAQLEEGFIAPLLGQLGWHSAPQQIITIQGKQAKPDWCLALDAEGKQAIIKSSGRDSITAICEAKSWGKPLDTGKAKREENPHHQLQDYLSTLRIRFGFLTNGRIWRLYDTDRITAQKTYIEFDLECIVRLEDTAEKNIALSLFTFFFGRNAYATHQTGKATQSQIEQAIADSSDFTLEVEENLKAVIYGVNGEDSLFELMGKAIYKANTKNSPALEAVYENSVILLFRLLFVVYFEDKNSSLLETHRFYKQHSLGNIYYRLRDNSKDRDSFHDGFFALKNLFEILDEGAEDIDIPLFNGGLFDPTRAPLLKTPKIFTNSQLRTILEKLLFKTNRGETLFETRRDFKNMSVSHLGRIYEGLLEFRFEKAQEDAVYLEYTTSGGKGQVEAYYDTYDAELVRKQKGFTPLREVVIRKGSLYLKSANNSRKSTASYYTPSSLSERLVKAGIVSALASIEKQGRKLADIKILDNACGSGHFLVESLNYLTDVALERLENDEALQSLVDGERKKISEQLKFLNLPYEPDDAQILKRALLKRCIYGVDLNPFAVELARLSLWMDSFIFGTPLSFIEHHVQHGNALMGATIADFIAYNKTENTQSDMFVDNLMGRFDELAGVMQKLDELRDTTTDEIEQSKKLWKTEIAPKLNLLSRALSFISTRAILKAESKAIELEKIDKTPNLLDLLFDESKNSKSSRNELLRLIEEYSLRYRFFHYEIAFPEAFAGGRQGFDAVIGNPPWDKTKFSDTDYFPQYHSSYRNLSPKDQTVVQERLLASKHIRDAYENTAHDMQIKNEYYKENYPYNRGTGDGNLFRFFVERNLGLISSEGSLNYVLPSALMFEEGSLDLRQYIFTKFQLSFFYCFHNRFGIFDIHRDTRFSLMQIVKQPPDETKAIDTAFYVLDPSELDDPNRKISYPLKMLKRLSPDQWSMMEVRDKNEFSLLERCYTSFLPLNESWINFRRELDMTNDKDLFLEKKTLGLFPLYQGETCQQFDNRFKQPQFWLNPEDFDQRIYSKELSRMAQDLKCTRKEAESHADAIRYDHEFIRLGFRAISNNTNERTLILSLLPKSCGIGSSIYVNVPKRYIVQNDGSIGIEAVSLMRLLFVLAWFNSLPSDWMLRRIVEKNVNKTFVYRLPIPQPSDDEIRSNPDYLTLVKNAALLSLASDWDSFAELAKIFAIQKVDVPVKGKARDMLSAENDKLVAKLYGIASEEFTHLLTSFPVLLKQRPEYVALLRSL